MTKSEVKEYLDEIDRIESKITTNEVLTEEEKKFIFKLFKDERFKYSEIA